MISGKPYNCSRWWGEKHIWGQWEVKERGDMNIGQEKRRVGKYLIQERKCQNCEKVEVDKITTYF